MTTALLILAILFQDDSLDQARKLIDEAAVKLKAAPAIAFECETLIGGGAGPPVPERTTYMVRRPDKLRWDRSRGEVPQWSAIFDGASIWLLNHLDKTFTRRDQPRSLKHSAGDNPVLLLHLDLQPRSILAEAKEVSLSRKKEGEETFDVIAWKAKDPYGRPWTVDHALWIDAARLPRRHTKSWIMQGRLETQHDTYLNIDLAPKFAPDAFTFTAPKGFREEVKKHPGPEIPDTAEARAAQSLLIEVHKAFASAPSLSYDTVGTSQTGDEKPVSQNPTSVTLMRPDLMRYSTQSKYGEYTFLTDGESLWRLMPFGQDFTRNDLSGPIHRSYMRVDPLIHLFFEGERPEILAGMKDIAVVKDTFEGEPCDVIQWTHSWSNVTMTSRVYVGADRRPRGFTIEMPSDGKLSRGIVTYKNFDLKPKATKESFTFRPGPAWTDRSHEVRGEKLIAPGKAAIDFEATDAGGKPVRLASFKGTPIVVLFGWYVDEGEFPAVQARFEEFAKLGFKVLAVGVTAEGPLPDPKKHRFTLLRLKDKAAAKAWGVDYFTNALYALDGDLKVLAATYDLGELRKVVK